MEEPYFSNDSKTNDVFMNEFKYLKKIKTIDELYLTSKSTVVIQDLTESSPNGTKTVKLSNIKNESNMILKNDLKAFELNDIPGLIVIPNPFRDGYQRYFVKKALVEYPNMPNKTNLDLHIKRNIDDNLWSQYMKSNDITEFNKLRWTTIGYHYDWTNKLYYENDFTPISNEIQELSIYIARLIGYEDYKPEAGIINYYHLNSTLSAHQDYSEYNMNAPLISISFGNPAIFLIGSDNKHTKPSSILIKSGDVVIMTSKCRLSYHAVPKILKSDLNQYFGNELNDDVSNEFKISNQEWSQYFNYININRINLNIRQVF